MSSAVSVALAICLRADHGIVDRVDMRRVAFNAARSARGAQVPVVSFAANDQAVEPLSDVELLTLADDETRWMALERWVCGRAINEICLAGGDIIEDLIPLAYAGNASGLRTSILLATTCTTQAQHLLRSATTELCARYGHWVLRATLPWAQPYDPGQPFSLREASRRTL
ncbi:MAG: hypothetical protein H3C62_00365 [Gemmatimonadaceae bacterium]|nr:hypothetical protein [Gemmatimonadaceae bacterium]